MNLIINIDVIQSSRFFCIADRRDFGQFNGSKSPPPHPHFHALLPRGSNLASHYRPAQRAKLCHHDVTVPAGPAGARGPTGPLARDPGTGRRVTGTPLRTPSHGSGRESLPHRSGRPARPTGRHVVNCGSPLRIQL